MITYVLEDGSENLLLSRHIEGKRHRGKQQVIHLTGFHKWMEEKELQRERVGYKGESIAESKAGSCGKP